jgi:hypothetical protein
VLYVARTLTVLSMHAATRMQLRHCPASGCARGAMAQCTCCNCNDAASSEGRHAYKVGHLVLHTPLRRLSSGTVHMRKHLHFVQPFGDVFPCAAERLTCLCTVLQFAFRGNYLTTDPVLTGPAALPMLRICIATPTNEQGDIDCPDFALIMSAPRGPVGC